MSEQLVTASKPDYSVIPVQLSVEGFKNLSCRICLCPSADRLTGSVLNRDAGFDSCVLLVIAHQFSAVRAAGRIVVLDRGRVAAVGSHDTLLNSSDYYRDLATGWSNNRHGAGAM